jgi:hypothetical protein
MHFGGGVLARWFGKLAPAEPRTCAALSSLDRKAVGGRGRPPQPEPKTCLVRRVAEISEGVCEAIFSADNPSQIACTGCHRRQGSRYPALGSSSGHIDAPRTRSGTPALPLLTYWIASASDVAVASVKFQVDSFNFGVADEHNDAIANANFCGPTGTTSS